jgi:hypothetical protein
MYECTYICQPFSRVDGEISNRSDDQMARKIGADAWFDRRPDLTPHFLKKSKGSLRTLFFPQPTSPSFARSSPPATARSLGPRRASIQRSRAVVQRWTVGVPPTVQERFASRRGICAGRRFREALGGDDVPFA